MASDQDAEERLKAALADRYTIEREIGRGGMATVYLAEDLKHHRKVAVKVLDPELAQALGTERFVREIETAANLTHPHILPLHDSGEADGFLYYVMPYVKGESLRSRLSKEKQLPVEDAIQITREIADALAYAHEEGVIHRDVKPANIMLEAGHAVLADFGIAHAIAEAEEERITRTGTSPGTPAYMSPEQATGEQDLDGRSDQYALGCVLYEMLAGEPPFTGPSAQAILARKSVDPVPGLRVVRETVPEALELVVMKALAKAPVDRYSTAGRFAEALSPEQMAAAVARAPGKAGPRLWRGVAVLLAVVIVGAGGWWVSNILRARTSPIERIAVLPFENFSNDPDQDHIVDGVHGAVISELQRIGALTVTPPRSVRRYRDSEMSTTEIAQKLGVHAILEGIVFMEDDTVRVQVSLYAETPEERLLWNETYDRSIENVLALHRNVASAVAEQVGATLTPQEETRLRLAEAPKVDPDAYDAYLRGLFIYDSRSRFDVAIEYFNQAIELDSSFALAHVGLANVYGTQSSFYIVPSREAVSMQKSEAMKALRIDSTLAEAHAGLANAKENGEYDWGGAEAAYRRAIQLDENYASAHQWYGQLLVYIGRTEEGLEELRKAVDLDPTGLAPNWILGWCLHLSRRHDDAIEQLRTTIELYPDHAYAHTFLAEALFEIGMRDRAFAEYQRALDMGGLQPTTLPQLGRNYGLAGHRDSAIAVLDTLLDRRATGEYVAPDMIAIVHIGLGQYDEALDWLERAYEEREQGLVYLKMAPWYDPLRDHPRFQDLLRRMSFPET